MKKNRIFNFKTFIAVLIIVTIGYSCVKKDIDFNNLSDQQWTPELAVPLINTSFTVKDILVETNKQGSIVVGNDGFCTLVYKGNLFSVKGADFIPLINQTFNTNYALTTLDVSGINTVPTNTTFTLNFNDNITYATASSLVKIDEITFKSGQINIAVNSNLSQPFDLTISIPTAKKNNISFKQTLAIPASSGSNVSANQMIDLTGYVFDLTNGGITQNELTINYSVVLTKTSANSAIGESISINETFSNQNFSLIKGDVGQQSVVANIDTVPLSIFKNAMPGGGDFRINYTSIKFDIQNSYGIPIRISDLQLFPYGQGQTFPSPVVPLPSAYNNLDINYPTTIGAIAYTYPPQIGGPNQTVLNNIVNAKPKNFIYKVSTITNPNGVPSSLNRNFITDTSKFKVDMELSLPLDGRAWDFIFRDTVDFNFGTETSENLNYLLLRTSVNNGFPFDVLMNIDFVDSNYVLKHTLNPNVAYADVIKSGAIDGSGKVTNSTLKTTDFTLTKSDLNNMKTVKHIIVRTKGSTTNNGLSDIKIYDYYKMDVKMGVKGEFNIPIKK